MAKKVKAKGKKVKLMLGIIPPTATTTGITVTGTVSNPNNPVTCVLTYMDAAGPPAPTSQTATPTGAYTWSVVFNGPFTSGDHYLFEAMAPAEGSSCTLITIP